MQALRSDHASCKDGSDGVQDAAQPRPLGQGPGYLRLAGMYPLLGQAMPWRLGHPAHNGQETPAPVYASTLDRVSGEPPCAMARAVSAPLCETARLLPVRCLRGNCKRREAVCEPPARAWRSWLSRRSHKGHSNGQQCVDAVPHKLPRPNPKIMHNIEPGQGQQSDAPHGVAPVWLAMGASWWLPRNRMREPCTSGSVGRTPGNWCLYPEPDRLQPCIFKE